MITSKSLVNNHKKKRDRIDQANTYTMSNYKSIYRSIPIPEEIIAFKLIAKMNNGILLVDVPKKGSSRPAGGRTRIQIG
jgi:HSP20 family molecular chaperone IbpA